MNPSPTETTPRSANLAYLGFRGLKFNYLGNSIRAALGLLIGVVLARILGPEPFGQIAVATLFLGLANLVSDFGLSAALVQKEQITSSEIQTVFTFQVVIGLALTIAMGVTAPALAQFFHSPDLTSILRGLSPIFVLQSFGQTSASLLKRDMSFSLLQKASVLSYLASYLFLGIPLALIGAGVWSLVCAQLVQAVLNSVMVFRYEPISPRVTLHSASRSLFGYSSRVVATNLVNWSISNVDNIIAGRTFGVHALGLYGRIFTLTYIPSNVVVPAIQSVLFPASARSRNNPTGLRQTYLAATTIVGIIMIPMMAGIAASGGLIVGTLLGSQWEEAIPLVAPLALAMALHSLLALPGPILWGIGNIGAELQAQTLSAILALLLMFIGSQVSLVIFSWMVLIGYILRWYMVSAAGNRALEVPTQRYLQAVARPVAVSLLTTSSVVLAQYSLSRTGASAIASLSISAMLGATVLALSISLAPRLALGPDGLWLLRQVRDHLPSFLSKAITVRLGETWA